MRHEHHNELYGQSPHRPGQNRAEPFDIRYFFGYQNGNLYPWHHVNWRALEILLIEHAFLFGDEQREKPRAMDGRGAYVYLRSLLGDCAKDGADKKHRRRQEE